MDEWKRSGQIPAFGNWEMANEMPITQYFECARQAGLVRFSSSSGETDPSSHGGGDLYSLDFNHKPPPPPRKKGNGNKEGRCVRANELVSNGKIMRKQQGGGGGGGGGKVWDVTDKHNNEQRSKQFHQNDTVAAVRRPSNAKPVDEDLYKIPPELLRTTKRKKMLGFISKCLVPAACVS